MIRKDATFANGSAHPSPRVATTDRPCMSFSLSIVWALPNVQVDSAWVPIAATICCRRPIGLMAHYDGSYQILR